MSNLNLYEIAKRQIEIEFEAETAEARGRRQNKLVALEQLRSTFQNVTDNSNDDEPAGSVLGSEVKAEHTAPRLATADGLSLSQRIKNEIALISEEERFAMPDIYNRLVEKYPEVKDLKILNVRSLIATHLKKLVDADSISLLSKGSAGSPNVYIKEPVPNTVDYRGLFDASAKKLLPDAPPFVLSEVAREHIKQFNGNKFDVGDVYALLCKAYPNEVTPEKKGSVSATISNLCKKGGLERSGLRNGKMTYRVKTA